MHSTYYTWQKLVFNYVVQVVNSQRGRYTAIILLHRRSGKHRHSPGSCELANVPKVGKCVKIIISLFVYYMVILSEMLNVPLFEFFTSSNRSLKILKICVHIHLVCSTHMYVCMYVCVLYATCDINVRHIWQLDVQI